MSDSELGDRSSLFKAESIPDAYERYVASALFEPWAELLLDTVGLGEGAEVLDVASGTGVAARAAARRVGESGRIVASDFSPAMLARSAAAQLPAGSAPVEFVEAAAEQLPFGDASFDFVLCQQGLQFFPQQQHAVDEMRRVLRPGGVVGIAVWAHGRPLVPFGVYCEELVAVGAEPPFPRAFDADSYTMGLESVMCLVEGAGFKVLEARVAELEVSWPDAATAAAGVHGTPYVASLNALSADQRERYETAALARFAGPGATGGPVRRQTAAVILRATAP
jgi:ubiquinone/menaquinone biosynthesis C-methylase UbiE